MSCLSGPKEGGTNETDIEYEDKQLLCPICLIWYGQAGTEKGVPRADRWSKEGEWDA